MSGSGMFSPDIPAYCSYFTILLVALVVARGTVNALVVDPARWGFADTWLLFAAHVAVPLAMFWVLDASGALHDTSLVAALLVGLGYREIMTGGVNSITMPADTSRLWQPFEKWVAAVAARVAVKNQARRVVIEDRLLAAIADDADARRSLLALALDHTRTRDDLLEQRDAIRGETKPATLDAAVFDREKERRETRLLLRDLRATEPDAYDKLLLEQKVVTLRQYYAFVQDRPMRLWPRVGFVAVFLVIAAGVWTFEKSERLKLRYHAWRFAKENATPIDRFRSRSFLFARLAPQVADPAAVPPATLDLSVRAVVERLIARLEFKDLPTQSTDDVLRLVVDAHNPALDAIAIPALIAVLSTENPDTRGRVAQALLDLHDLDDPKSELPADLRDWKPSTKEPVVETNRRAGEWAEWWRSAHH